MRAARRGLAAAATGAVASTPLTPLARLVLSVRAPQRLTLANNRRRVQRVLVRWFFVCVSFVVVVVSAGSLSFHPFLLSASVSRCHDSAWHTHTLAVSTIHLRITRLHSRTCAADLAARLSADGQQLDDARWLRSMGEFSRRFGVSRAPISSFPLVSVPGSGRGRSTLLRNRLGGCTCVYPFARQPIRCAAA